MKRPAILSIAGAVVAVIALTGSVMAADVNNGSFEGTLTPSWPNTGLAIERVGVSNSSATTIPGWIVTAGNVDWVGNTYWPASQGTKSVDLDGVENANGAISQTIATVVGNTYVVTFDLSGNPDAGPTLKTGTIVATATPSATFSYDTGLNGTTRSLMNYVPTSYSFVATTTLTTLTFASTTTPGGYGPVIDNVVVTETAPTGANCKNGGWRTMFDSLTNPFKNQGDCVSYFATDGRNLAAG